MNYITKFCYICLLAFICGVAVYWEQLTGVPDDMAYSRNLSGSSSDAYESPGVYSDSASDSVSIPTEDCEGQGERDSCPIRTHRR
jgi:hypothetical protein